MALTTEHTIALAGNPNVGKSTVFNALTGLNQHTGNWPGKTITNAQGTYIFGSESYTLVDLPGTYSLLSSSPEEEIARDFICFGGGDATIIVADATCLERNLNLVLQVLEITDRALLCVNLLDEARKKGILIDLSLLSKLLGIPVVGAEARQGVGLDELIKETAAVAKRKKSPLRQSFAKNIADHSNEKKQNDTNHRNQSIISPVITDVSAKISYLPAIENAISTLESVICENETIKALLMEKEINFRWLCLRLLDLDDTLYHSITAHLGIDLLKDHSISEKLMKCRKDLEKANLDETAFRDNIVSTIVEKASKLYGQCVTLKKADYQQRDRRLDKILTSKATGIPIMVGLLFLIFWITITGANYPSQALSALFDFGREKLHLLCISADIPLWLYGALIDGVYTTLTWVVSVMLPPMAIFFPLFTLLEDSGYLPRIAFNMDRYFKKACAHGKQSLTMCMGFGCNACGVIGCRIIDSPRERMIAILTNNLVPCNGRFPTLIALITMFFTGAVTVGPSQSIFATLLLTGMIVLGVAATLGISRLLSKTVLKGMPSSFALELPPYRRPQFGKVILRSILDRTLFVLGRAVIVAAPAGLLIWILANVQIGNISILSHCTQFLDPFARLFGLDGVIFMAFILGWPANEIVLPIIIMTYLSTGTLTEMSNLSQLHLLLTEQGWTWVTALCTMLFCLFHFPCGTTCLTIKKETGSWKWTALAFAIPTGTGLISCFLISHICSLFL